MIMVFIAVYELGVIYADWNRVKMINVRIKVLNEQLLPVSDVSFSVNDEFVGFSDLNGKITAPVSKPGEVRITAKKKPFDDIDTTVAVGEEGTDVVFSVRRPFASLTITAVNEAGEPMTDVNVSLDGNDRGRTGEDGSLKLADFVRIQDTADVKLSKSGYDDVSEDIYLVDLNQADSLIMIKQTAPSPRPTKTTPPKPKPEPSFQTYVNRASGYLDRAISGESKYFGRALTEIEKAIRLNPKSLLAKQLKVEILYNFAKSLRESNLPYEAANRLGEALKMYRDLPQDPLYNEVYKLKSEIDRQLGG